MALGPNAEEGALYSLVTNLVTNFSPNLVTNLLNFGKVVSNCNGVKKGGFYEKLSQNGDPPPRIAFVKSLFRFFQVNFSMYFRFI